MWKLLLGILSFWMSIKITPKKIVHYLEQTRHSERNNLAFVTPQTVRASCVQLTNRRYNSLSDYLDEMLARTKSAVDAGAHLVVFPAYTGLLAGTILPCYERILHWATGGKIPADLELIKLDSNRITALAEAFHHFIYEAYMYTFSTIARIQHVYIVAGTSLFYEQGKLYHRCVVFGPDGEPVGAQDKTSPIGFDRALGVTPSDQIEVIPTPMGNLGIVIGSDAYYFECFKIASAKGAQLIAVPDAKGGIMHDLLRCRASENGVYALYSCLAQAPGNLASCAGIYAPMSITHQRDGIIARAADSSMDVLTYRINLQKLDSVLREPSPNRSFLTEDYLRSYRYCGSLPIVEPATPLE
ncbi:nitrilase-related carbon-nitrogen hydrolase [Oscillospiraceae bacterium PP1C4]